MSETEEYSVVVNMLQSVAGLLKANRDHLSRLDAETGDGDHGTAVSKVADAIVDTIAQDDSKPLKTQLKDIGWAAMSTDAGSTSPLYGSLFMGMSDATPENNPIDSATFVDMLESGVAKLRKNTRAEPGGKTMIDALLPALSAIRSGSESQGTLQDAMAAGADEAHKGAESTKDMKATFGRAKNIGDRSIGHIDPGATSMALFFEGQKQGLQDA